jgi:AmmeMemoRadiSam system protein B
MKTNNVRPPAVAGMFYPSSAYELQSDVEEYMALGHIPRPAPRPKVLIAPHAGYPYSGPIAGSAFKCLKELHHEITRVVLVGPSHHVAFRGLALSSAGAFRTPLGKVDVDTGSVSRLADTKLAAINDRAHRDEHCLEVELPFLQCALDQFTVVPVLTGETSPAEVATCLQAVRGGPETLIVISSDLSHYLPYDNAVAMDQRTAEAIVALSPNDIHADMACGQRAIQGLLVMASELKLQATLLDLRNSGDTAGEKDQVVGYGAFVFSA